MDDMGNFGSFVVTGDTFVVGPSVCDFTGISEGVCDVKDDEIVVGEVVGKSGNVVTPVGVVKTVVSVIYI